MSLSKILDYLYCGNYNSIKKNLGFSFVVCCANELELPASFKCDGIKLNIDDNEWYDSHKYYNAIVSSGVLGKINQYINQQKSVLIYCRAGSQRSCALVAIYLIKYHNLELSEAIKHIYLCRPYAFNGGIKFIDTIKLSVIHDI
jgi:hypothetical protein